MEVQVMYSKKVYIVMHMHTLYTCEFVFNFFSFFITLCTQVNNMACLIYFI